MTDRADRRQRARPARVLGRAPGDGRHRHPHAAPRRRATSPLLVGGERHPMTPRARRRRLRGDRARAPSTDYRSTSTVGLRRPVPAPADPGRARPAPDRRGPPRATVDGARGAGRRDGGVAFAVWAPNAQGVRVVGDFTGWGPHDGWPMRSHGRQRRLGAARARRHGRAAVQVPHPRPGRGVAGEGRPAGRATPRCPTGPRRWSSSPTTSGATPTGWPAPGRRAPHGSR